MHPSLRGPAAAAFVAGVLAFGAGPAAAQTPPPIEVSVVDDQLVIYPEGHEARRGETIVWQLMTPGYSFTPQSIQFRAQGNQFQCQLRTARLIACTSRRDADAGEVPYVIALSKNGQPPRPLPQPYVFIQLD